MALFCEGEHGFAVRSFAALAGNLWSAMGHGLVTLISDYMWPIPFSPNYVGACPG